MGKYNLEFNIAYNVWQRSAYSVGSAVCYQSL